MRNFCLAIGAVLIAIAASSQAGQVETIPAPAQVVQERKMRAQSAGTIFSQSDNPAAYGCAASRFQFRRSWLQAAGDSRYQPDYGATHGWSPQRSSGRWDPSQARD